MLCDDLEGWDRGGKEAQKRGGSCILMADSCVVWQKLTQHCKALILQLKKKKTLLRPSLSAVLFVRVKWALGRWTFILHSANSNL